MELIKLVLVYALGFAALIYGSFLIGDFKVSAGVVCIVAGLNIMVISFKQK